MKLNFSMEWLVDTLERAAATYVQSLLALLIVTDITNIDAVKAALISVIPAALSVIKSAIATQIGSPDSASLVPSVGEPTVTEDPVVND